MCRCARLLHLEAGLAGRLFPDGLDLLDTCACRSSATPLEQRLDLLVRALEDGLDAPVVCVPDPAGHAERLGARSRLRSEEHTLDAAPDAHAHPRQARKPSFPTSGTKRHGTEWTTAGPSGLRTITSSRCARCPPTGTTSLPRGRSCS